MFEECNNKCNCGPTVPFEPVCDREGAITFFSPCHAGCTGANDTLGTKVSIHFILSNNNIRKWAKPNKIIVGRFLYFFEGDELICYACILDCTVDIVRIVSSD